MTMRDSDWKAAEEFAAEVFETENASGELGKVLAFINKRRGRGEQAGKELDTWLERISNSGRMFSHTQNTAEYYRVIRDARKKHLAGLNDADQLAQIMGWAKRLAKSYEVLGRSYKSLGISKPADTKPQEPKIDSQLAKLQNLKIGAPGDGAAAAVEAVGAPSPPEEKKTLLKQNDQVRIKIEKIQGQNCIGYVDGVEIRVDKAWGLDVGVEIKVQLVNFTGQFWKGKRKG